MYYIGIDLGGTNIAAGLVNEEGKITFQKSIPTLKERPIEKIVEDMVNLAEEIIKENNLTKEDIHSVGVGSPGTIDTKAGVILYSNNIFIRNYNMVEAMNEKLELPVYIANDADSAALGEATSGIAKGMDSAIVITLGTGIGGGIIINGEIFTGGFPGAAELGHHVIKVGGLECTCGRKGCFEQYASATALIRDAKAAAKDNPKSKLNELVGGDLANMNAKIPFDAAQAGDEIASKVIDNYISDLATGIANIISIFKPKIIALGGGVAKQEDNLINPLIEKVKAELFTGSVDSQIKTASLGNDAGIIGAAMLGKQDK